MSMSNEVANELEAARTAAGRWAKMQYAANMHLINTGRRNYCSGHAFRTCRLAGEVAMQRIEQIKREYPTR